jgi:hypothetical protein
MLVWRSIEALEYRSSTGPRRKPCQQINIFVALHVLHRSIRPHGMYREWKDTELTVPGRTQELEICIIAYMECIEVILLY